jgi:hypothetical protein
MQHQQPKTKARSYVPWSDMHFFASHTYTINFQDHYWRTPFHHGLGSIDAESALNP